MRLSEWIADCNPPPLPDWPDGMRFATCADTGKVDCLCREVSSGKPFSRYWAKLDRQLSAYMRQRREAEEYDPEDAPKPEPAHESAALEAADYRSDRHHNGRMIAQGDRRFDPARWADNVSDLRNFLQFVDSETAIVVDREWELNPATLKYPFPSMESADNRPLRLPVRAPDVRSFNRAASPWQIVDANPAYTVIRHRSKLPEPILSPEYVACQELADAWRREAGIETQRDAALRFVAQQSARMAEAIKDARQERVTTGEAIDPDDLFALADRCDSTLQAAGIAARAFHLLAKCGS